MSEEGGFGLTFAEKFFGLLILVVGAVAAYYTFTSIEALGAFVGLFGFLSIVLIVLGLFLISVKVE